MAAKSKPPALTSAALVSAISECMSKDALIELVVDMVRGERGVEADDVTLAAAIEHRANVILHYREDRIHDLVSAFHKQRNWRERHDGIRDEKGLPPFS